MGHGPLPRGPVDERRARRRALRRALPPRLAPPVTQTTEASNLLKREQVALPLQLGVKPLLFLCLKPIIRSMLKPLKSLGEVNFYSPLLACGFADKLPYFAPLGFK